MKRLSLFLVLLCAIFSIYANEVKLTCDKRSESVKNRPRMPSRVWIICDAGNGILTFAPSDYYVTLSVTVENEDTGEGWEGIITDGNMSMEYSTLPGTYSITCVNESENIFVGNIYQ